MFPLLSPSGCLDKFRQQSLLYYGYVAPAPLCVLANVASGLWWNRGPYPFVGHLVFSTLHCTGCLSAKRYEKRYEKYLTTIVVAFSSGWAYDDVHKNLARILHSCAMMNSIDQSQSCHPEPFAALRINSAKDLPSTVILSPSLRSG